MNPDEFICGIAEGFYGRPWSHAQRRRLFDWMQRWGLNTYLYAPKDDLKHRTRWRELYEETEAIELKNLISDCHTRRIKFIYAIAPGLDFNAADPGETLALCRKAKQILDLGCQNFAVLYDDLDTILAIHLAVAPGSVAGEQAATANQLLNALKSSSSTSSLIFCPTEYCARKAIPSVKDSAYLRTLGKEFLLPLKLQGMAEITDSALVMRLKFTVKPTNPSIIQREALKRIHGAFARDGIEFAAGVITVQPAGTLALTAGSAAAAATAVAAEAAAQSAG